MSTVKGRYPGSTPFRSEAVEARATVALDGSVKVRVDDRSQPAFWLEAEVPASDVEYEVGSAEYSGKEYIAAQLRLLAAMCEKAPIMKERVTKALTALEAL